METNKKIKIFLVDNNLIYLNLYQESLKRLGYTDSEIFLSGTGCLNAISKQPDVIFLDNTIDNANASEVLKKIKLLNPKIYVVMVIDPEEIRMSINTSDFGIFDYIIKGNDEIEKAESILLRIEKMVSQQLKKCDEAFCDMEAAMSY